MRRVFLDGESRLRNGWWIAIFVLLLLATRFVYTPISRALQDLGLTVASIEPLRVAMVLLVTWVCVRLRKESLASVGLRLGLPWVRQLGAGALIGVASALAVGLLMWATGNARFELDPDRGVTLLTFGLYAALFVALFEELLFRGFVFQRMMAGLGAWPALLVMSLLFATSHWGNPDMEGSTLAWATLELFLGATLLGLAYLRTRSLALPIGLHFGWNWGHGSLLGFDVSGFEVAGWLQPALAEGPAWLTGGKFGPEATIFAVTVDAALIIALWWWRPQQPSAAGAESAV